MSGEKPNPTPRRPCKAAAACKRRCWAKEGSDWCSNHDPAEADRRSAAGRIRHPRFARAVIDKHKFNESKAPTIAHIVDRALGIADDVQAGKIAPRNAQAAIVALKLVWQALVVERAREEKLKWVWEQARDVALAREEVQEGVSEADRSSNNQVSDPPLPAWMRPRPTN